MIISTYQPYFAPFPGFFFKALHSDLLILMDGVQFPRGATWLTRNRFKNDQGTLLMTVPVWKKGLGLQKINEVRICNQGRWAKKHLAGLKSAYAKAPFFEDHLGFLEGIYTTEFERLIDLNLEVIKYLMEGLRIPSRIELLSRLEIAAKEPTLSVELCRRLGATHFLANYGAKKYLDQRAFQEAGIELRFFTLRPPVYPQLWGRFLPNLSAFDLLFNCGPKGHQILAQGSRRMF